MTNLGLTEARIVLKVRRIKNDNQLINIAFILRMKETKNTIIYKYVSCSLTKTTKYSEIIPQGDYVMSVKFK